MYTHTYIFLFFFFFPWFDFTQAKTGPHREQGQQRHQSDCMKHFGCRAPARARKVTPSLSTEHFWIQWGWSFTSQGFPSWCLDKASALLLRTCVQLRSLLKPPQNDLNSSTPKKAMYTVEHALPLASSLRMRWTRRFQTASRSHCSMCVTVPLLLLSSGPLPPLSPRHSQENTPQPLVSSVVP